MSVPDWYALLLLGLGVFRLCRLAGWDEITAPYRARFGLLADEEYHQWTDALNAVRSLGQNPWHYNRTDHDSGDFLDTVALAKGMTTGTPVGPLVSSRLIWDKEDDLPTYPLVPFSETRWYLAKLVRCPWCLGFWLSVAAWGAYQADQRGTLVAMSLFAASALPGLIAKNLDQ